ncbi:hypothetical protein [Leptospira kanakyensis]|uniref:hypothetical protein n=1 Tax=Leptospira kanakyensis TaxID=2484968 RepID=UPI00223DC20F|nr:hypothetical protein [Leptospira kanakyensis]MCW7471835.1 hypothetical protein [Leptospira kanakyensis]
MKKIFCLIIIKLFIISISIYNCELEKQKDESYIKNLDEKSIPSFLLNHTLLQNKFENKINLKINYIQKIFPEKRILAFGDIIPIPEFPKQERAFIASISTRVFDNNSTLLYISENSNPLLVNKIIDLNNDGFSEIIFENDNSGNGYTDSHYKILDGLTFTEIFNSPKEYSANSVKYKNSISYTIKENSYSDIILKSLMSSKNCDIFKYSSCKLISKKEFIFSFKSGSYDISDLDEKRIYTEYFKNYY